MIEVQAVSSDRKFAILGDDEVVVFDHWIDSDGEDTDNLKEAVCGVAPMKNGRYVQVDFREFDTVMIQ